MAQKLSELVDEAIRLEAICLEKTEIYEVAYQAYRGAPVNDKRTKVYKNYDKASKEMRVARSAYHDVVHQIGMRAIANTKGLRAQYKQR